MKIYAKQVNPEYQESPLFIEGCFPDNIILTGNRDYNSHTTPEFDQIEDHFEDMAGTRENDRFFFQWNGAGYDKITKKPDYTLQELLTEYGFSRPDGKPWTTKQRHEWRLLMEREELDNDGIIKALQLLTGKAWKAFTIRGCCQSDWQSGFCPVDEWSREALEAFEVEYFNTGTEWIIHDEAGEPESPEEISGHSIYVTEWREEDIAARIAEEFIEGRPEDVILYFYDGETRTPKYRKAG